MNLKQAAQHLYEAFQFYPLRGSLRGRSCECCVSEDEIRELTSQSLERLSADEIGHFSRSAISTFGDVDDLKHFLPRILELMMFSDNEILDDFLTFEKLNYSKWETWNTEEIQAIKNYFLALWNDVISDEEVSVFRIEEVLLLTSKYAGIDHALDIWEESYSKKSIEFMVDFVIDGKRWRLENFQSDTLLDWLTLDLNLKRIEALYFETKDELKASRASVAYTLLEKRT